MGLFESLSDFFSRDVYAEEPATDAEDDAPEAEGEDAEAKPADDEAEGDEEEDDDDDEDDEEEEEEEEEPEDIMPKLQEECARTAACAHHKHEFDHCQERVTRWNDADEEEREKLGPKEDCVEEFFEYTHCISQCAAPKLFKALK